MIVFLPAYTALEQIAAPGTTGSVWGQISTSWAASCELLTGAPAFRDNGMHDQNSSILEDTQVISRWNCRHGNELEKIILRCLAKKPEDRFASVTSLIRDLESVQTPGG